MLPEFADARALPAAAGFGARILLGHELREVLADISSDGGAGAMEVEAGGQLVGQEGEVEGPAVGQEVGQEVMGGLRPSRARIRAGGLGLEGPVALQPLMAQLIKPGRAQMQSLGGGGGIEWAVVEGRQDFLNVERRDTMGELGLFILGLSVLVPNAPGQTA